MKNIMNLKPTLILVGVFLTIILTHHFLTNGDRLLLPKVEARAQDRLKKLPDFSKIGDVSEKKETFFSTLYPIIQEENHHVLKLRVHILELQSRPFDQLSAGQLAWLGSIAKHYRLMDETIDPSIFEKLLTRVDYVPPSLALTQAAIESGWGTSRFSKQGNNLFGQWCFSKGCGLVPSSRDVGKAHEVAKFDTVNKAVRSYIRNLNTHDFYAGLRLKRAQLRKNNEALTGVSLAKTLHKYSEGGSRYITKVTRFIHQNNLQRFTNEFERTLSVATNQESFTK